MKLKKIASLALAGVMAVSMMSACGNTVNNGGASSGNNTGETSGYSAMLGKYMEETSKMDYVTFQDNSADAAALKTALGNFGSLTIAGGSVLPYVVDLSGPNKTFGDKLGINKVRADLVEALNLVNCEKDKYDKDDLVTNELGFENKANVNANMVQKTGALFAVDSTINMENVMDQIANGDVPNGVSLDSILKDMPEKGVVDKQTYQYKYTVSASVVSLSQTSIEGLSGSCNFILVTVTRTPSIA